MSAAAIGTSAVDHASAPGHESPGRPHLVVVPAGPAVGGRGRTRLTPMGRLVLLVVVAGLAVGLSLSLLGGGGPSTHSVTVTRGQTLSEVAARELPGVSVADAVAAIQLANHLPNGQVQAGQVLVIPGG